MEFEQGALDNISILKISGDITLYNAGELKQKINQLMSEGVLRIVLDLSGVAFIDSSGIGAMISVKTLLKKKGGDIKLSNAGDTVKSVFTLTRLNQIFDFRESAEEAAAAFGS